MESTKLGEEVENEDERSNPNETTVLACSQRNNTEYLVDQTKKKIEPTIDLLTENEDDLNFMLDVVNIHMEPVQIEDPMCEICGVMVSDNEELNDHIRSDHHEGGVSNVSPTTCNPNVKIININENSNNDNVENGNTKTDNSEVVEVKDNENEEILLVDTAHQCAVCDKTFNSEDECDTHFSTHGNMETVISVMKKVEKLEKMYKHMFDKQERLVICLSDQVRFLQSSSVKTVDSYKPVENVNEQITKVDTEVVKETNVVKSTKTKKPHNEGQIQCNDCGYKAENFNTLDDHIAKKHMRPLNGKKLTLLVGDSHMKTMNPRVIEKVTGGLLFAPGYHKPREGRAYTSTKNWPGTRYHQNSMIEKIPELLKVREYSNLIMMAPCNDITNLKNITENKSVLYKRAEESSRNTLQVAENALQQFPSLEQVVIMLRPPRADNLSDLSETSNFILTELHRQSRFSDRIVIGIHKSLYDITADREEAIFGSPSSRQYDGIHMMGRQGMQLFTDSIIAIIKSASGSVNQWKTVSRQTYSQVTKNTNTDYDTITIDNSYNVLN